MAYNTLKGQVDTLSTISTSDSGIITGYLIDGAKDLIHKLAKLDPLKLELFSTTDTISDGDGYHVPSGIIINVQRAVGSKVGTTQFEDFRSANKIPKAMAERVLDESGFFFRSKYNPVYYIEDSRVFVLPEPISAVEDNPDTDEIDESIIEEKGRITFVPIPLEGKVDLDEENWADLVSDTHKYIRYVPERYTYPIVIYAAKRVIDARMRVLGHSEEDIEMLQALQVLSSQLDNEYNAYLMLGAAQPNPAQSQAPQRDEREARR